MCIRDSSCPSQICLRVRHICWMERANLFPVADTQRWCSAHVYVKYPFQQQVRPLIFTYLQAAILVNAFNVVIRFRAFPPSNHHRYLCRYFQTNRTILLWPGAKVLYHRTLSSSGGEFQYGFTSLPIESEYLSGFLIWTLLANNVTHFAANNRDRNCSYQV